MSKGVPMDIFQTVEAFARLGKEIKITPKSNISINKEGFKVECVERTVSINVKIGLDHTALVVMTEDAWKALKAGDEVSVTTTKEQQKKFR
jgi:hypothetical protein